MKSTLLLVILLLSNSAFAQNKGAGKAVNEVLPRSVQGHDAIKAAQKKPIVPEPPCDEKEDILKKLEEKKKEEAKAGKGLSLQGATDTGCSLK